MSRHTLWRFLERRHVGGAVPSAVLNSVGGDVAALEAATLVKGGVKTYQRGVAVQDKCPFKWPAEMSLGYAAMVSDEDVVGPAQGRRVGGPSASRYFLTVALWIPNSRSIARSDIPLRLAF